MEDAEITKGGHGGTFKATSRDGSLFITYSDELRRDVEDIWGLDLGKFLEELLTRQKDLDEDRTGEHKFKVSNSMDPNGNFSMTISIVPKKEGQT